MFSLLVGSNDRDLCSLLQFANSEIRKVPKIRAHNMRLVCTSEVIPHLFRRLRTLVGVLSRTSGLIDLLGVSLVGSSPTTALPLQSFFFFVRTVRRRSTLVLVSCYQYQ